MGLEQASKGGNAAFALEQWNVIISTGFAGALVPAQIGDMLVGTIVLDGSIADGSSSPVKVLACDQFFQDRAQQMVKGLSGNCLVGPIVTVNRVLVTSQEKKDLSNQTRAVGVDMESAELARLAKDRNIPCLVVRSISDLMEENLPLDFNVFKGTKGWVHGIVKVLSRPSCLIALHRFGRQSKRAALQLTRFFEKFLIGMTSCR